MAKHTVEYLPFHALNEFMRPDYRQAVVRAALAALPKLPKNLREPIDRLTKRVVRVPGFRDATLAPPSLKTGPTVEAFGKSSELVAAVLAAWSESLPDLRSRVYDLLTARGWDVLPADSDRTQLPGFLTKWPKRDEDFDVLNKAYAEKYPDHPASTDDVSLMVVWLSGRLPYQTDEADPHDHEHEPADAPDEGAGEG